MFKSHILFTLPWNQVLAVYASKGFDVTCRFLVILIFLGLFDYRNAYTFWPSNAGFLETEQHWKDFVAGVWG